VGETQEQPFQLSFNSSLKVDFQGSRVTSDGGLVLVRELDERLGFGELITRHLADSRGKNTQLPLADLLRQSVYSRLAGYEDLNDAARLSQDPTFRLIGSKKIWERGAALTSRLQSFETELLTQADNFAGLAALNRELVARAETIASPRRIVLDRDSTEVRVHGQQEQSAYNGHFESICYHPLLLFNREGDCLAAKLCPGNVHSAEGWQELLLPEIKRQQALGKEIVFRADAAFAKPELYAALEERDVKYAIRLPANDHLQRSITELLTRPVGRPSSKPVVWFRAFFYQAASWQTARRVVAKVEFHCGELFPRVGFIVTNLGTSSRAVVRFYNKRGHGRAVDKGRQTGGRDDAAFLPPLSRQRGQVVAEHYRLQPGQSLAAAGAADAGRHLVADQFAAAVSEDRRTAHPTCTLLLVAAGGEPSDAAAVRGHAGEDRDAAGAGRIK
jgi:Transposase DDE domain group 1